MEGREGTGGERREGRGGGQKGEGREGREREKESEGIGEGVRGSGRRMGIPTHYFRIKSCTGPTGTWVRLAVQNFTSIGARGWVCGPKISKISTFW